METKYPVEVLKEVFDAVVPNNDWKGEIQALIPYDTFELVSEAVAFYTATELKVIGGPEIGTGRILVRADGYRKGPAGDH